MASVEEGQERMEVEQPDEEFSDEESKDGNVQTMLV